MAYRGMAHLDRAPREVFPLAKAAAEQALRLDPDSPEALMASGRVRHLYDWDWNAAEALFRRALDLKPSLMEAHLGYAHLLTDLGRHEEGLDEARQAVDLDPLSPLVNSLAAGFCTAGRREEEAHAWLDRALELRPDFWVALTVRGGMALDRGDVAAALSDLTRAVGSAQRAAFTLATLALAQSAAGRREDVLATARELEARAAASYVSASNLAAVQLALGHREHALTLLERALQERDIRMVFLRIDARWNPLREEPRFVALAQRMGLVAERGYSRL